VATWQLCPALGHFAPHHVLLLQQRSAMCAATAASKDLGKCRLWAVRIDRHLRRKAVIRCERNNTTDGLSNGHPVLQACIRFSL
jgi:hypothetical protein